MTKRLSIAPGDGTRMAPSPLLASRHARHIHSVVRREEAERTLAVAVLGPGDAVGEVSLVLRRPTNAAVVALEATVAMVLQPAHFMDVVRGNPALLASLYELAVARDEEMHSVVAQAPDDAEHLLIV
jgi:cAMP-dependent protein kinase regulator